MISYQKGNILSDLYHITSAEYYVKVMSKVQEKGDEYIKTESDRLGRMMGTVPHVLYYIIWGSVIQKGAESVLRKVMSLQNAEMY